MDRLRDQYLRRFGFDDPYRNIKRKENEAALAIYPRLIAELDSRPDRERMGELVAGVFAGNIFDLGAMATVKQYHAGGLDFFATRSKLAPRPWLEDNADTMAEAWSAENWRYRKVVFFADNAGCDFVLGCLPLIREFACRRFAPLPGPLPKGREMAEVVITVNTGPSLNDILPDEAAYVLAEASRVDPLLAAAVAAGRIRVVPSGNTAPLIDLADVSAGLAAEAVDADLLILEGMGRSVESNHFARFTVDTAKLALLKDVRVAARIGGNLFDVCCKFEKSSD
ncbi:MAG: ARMT1-like domain-containing protein [Phycisphaerae bacterium]|nr:ARMT1-like domain-containing protein [Phycisphaerae bacterium]